MTEPKFLLDTNSLIYLAERSSVSVIERAEEYSPGELVTSSIVFAEFARGVDWSRPFARTTAERFFEVIPVLPFDRQAALVYASLPFRRHSFDRLIAAHALAMDLTLVTANPRDFRDVPEIAIEDWTR